MKYQGSFFEYEQERNEDLIRAFCAKIGSSEIMSLDDMWKEIAAMPSKRFWVTKERAAIIVSRIAKGDNLNRMRELKREMFFEIYDRVKELKTSQPHTSLIRLCSKVVNSPAPKFYMTPDSVRVIIYKIKRGWYKERKRKLRFLF